MANFQTHLNGAILVSGASLLALLGAGWITTEQTLPYFVVGVVGGLLPDIDADASRPVRGFFSVLGIGVAFVITLPLVGRLSTLELALLWAGLFVGVRYLVFALFTRLTVHRGLWHSWTALAFVSLIAVHLAYHLLDVSAPAAWTAGLMMAIGYLTHLCLDEFSSVDLVNSRVRASFGTALKPFSFAAPWSSLAMAAGVAALFWLAPPMTDWDGARILEHWAATLRTLWQPGLDWLREWAGRVPEFCTQWGC